MYHVCKSVIIELVKEVQRKWKGSGRYSGHWQDWDRRRS